MLRKLIRAWRQTDVNVDAQAAAAGEPAGVGNAITGAKNGLVLLSPGKRPAQLVLMEIAVLLVVLAVIEPVDIFRIGPEAEGLANVRDRAREIGQQVLRSLHVCRIDTLEIRRFHILDLDSASEAVVLPLHVIRQRAPEGSGP